MTRLSTQSKVQGFSHCPLSAVYGRHPHAVSTIMRWTRSTNRLCIAVSRQPRNPLSSRVKCQNLSTVVRSTPSSERDFTELAAMCGTGLNKVTARTTENQMGLVATEAIVKGEVMIRVPLAACLSFDDEGGVTLPNASWSLLASAVASAQESERPPTWDMLIALALVDAKTGTGDPFTERYIDSFMPGPNDLATPFTQSAEGLKELQHPKVEQAALQRRQILDDAFPDLSDAYLGGTETTIVQWALACVRSRAFQLTKTLFAQVPFCDLANHAERANAMVRPIAESDLSPDTSEPEDLDAEMEAAEQENLEAQGQEQQLKKKQKQSEPTDLKSLSVVLVATEDIKEGDEVKISYTGVSGATNRRLMVQYGFVVPENPHDRLDFELFDGYVSTTPLRGAPGAALSLSRVQDFMGDETFQGLLSGSDVPLLCALKSIPTYSMETSELPHPKQVLRDEKGTVEKLKAKLGDIEKEFTTTLEYDQTKAAQPNLTAWESEALAYRIERKKLAAAARRVLEMYEEIVQTNT